MRGGTNNTFCPFFCGLECVGQSFAYVAHFVFLRNVWIRTPAESCRESRHATNLATHLPDLATHLPNLATHLPNLATHLLHLAAHLPYLATNNTYQWHKQNLWRS